MVVDNISTTYLIPKAILLIGIGFAVISAVVYIQLQADGLLLGHDDRHAVVDSCIPCFPLI